MTTAAFRCVNMDAASDGALRRIGCNPSDPRWRVACFMLRARKYRLSGRVDDALTRERLADLEITLLPRNLRW
jgi:hypothetical protein